jgi:hypothetical protein
MVPTATNIGDHQSNIGQTLVKHWSNIGQTLVKHWSNIGQALVKHWSNIRQAIGQTLVKHWLKILVKHWLLLNFLVKIKFIRFHWLPIFCIDLLQVKVID